jgi:hypothetical protein
MNNKQETFLQKSHLRAPRLQSWRKFRMRKWKKWKRNWEKHERGNSSLYERLQTLVSLVSITLIVSNRWLISILIARKTLRLTCSRAFLKDRIFSCCGQTEISFTERLKVYQVPADTCLSIWIDTFGISSWNPETKTFICLFLWPVDSCLQLKISFHFDSWLTFA